MVLLRLYKITAIILWSIFLGIVSIPYQLRGSWSNIKKLCRMTQLWHIGTARIINLRVKVYGDIPKTSGVLLVSNHLGYIDIVTHGAILPMRYSPKIDIAGWPVLGWYIGLSRPIWIHRESKSSSKKILRNYIKTMRHGIDLAVYPEGTSTDGKHGILPFKSTPFEAAIEGDIPIVPVITRYIDDPKNTVCWYGEMTLLPHMWQVLGMPSIKAEVHFLKPISPSKMTRKELAGFVHDMMSKEYAKIGG